MNPITAARVCSCTGQVSDYVGYYISGSCAKIDIDECAANNGGCQATAVCNNLDGTLQQGTRNCICPPGMIGDGINECRFSAWAVHFDVVLIGMSVEQFNAPAFIESLRSNSVVPSALVSASDITVLATNYTAPMVNANPARGRLLLAASVASGGTEVQVSIMGGSQAEVNEITSALVLSNLGLMGAELLQEPWQNAPTQDNAFGPITDVMGGFVVDSVNYVDSAAQWVVNARFQPDIPNTIASLYVTKGGQPTTANSFYSSQHPCMQTFSVCCLKQYRDIYTVGAFGQNIADVLGECGPQIQSQDTLGMFDEGLTDSWLLNTFAGFPNSEVVRVSHDSLQLRIADTELKSSMSVVEEVQGTSTTTITFFVGIAYYTLLPANALATTVSQYKITISQSNGLTFTFAAQQDYTFVNYITMSLYQNKWAENALVTRQLQFARVGVVVPKGVRQNMRDGLVPLGSVRFAVAQTLPSMTDTTAWRNPCYSNSGADGMWDASQPWQPLYTAASAQQCAMSNRLCMNPVSADLSTNLVQFDFPIGDGTLNDEIFTSLLRYNLYVYFDLSVIDAQGKEIITKVFAQAMIRYFLFDFSLS